MRIGIHDPDEDSALIGLRLAPWVPVEKELSFETADGTTSLAELFDGHSQLVVYHFMFGPDYAARWVALGSK